MIPGIMDRVVHLFGESARWIVKNPVLLLLVVLLVAYNELTGTDSILRSVDWTSGESLLAAGETVLASFLTPFGSLALLGSMLVAAAVSMFNIGANFAVFAKRPGPLKHGMRSAFSLSTLELFVFQVVVCGIAVLLYAELSRLIVGTLGIGGLPGALAMLFMAVVGYPLVFMVMATMSTIFAAHVSLYGKWHLTRTACAWPNLSRLLVFYVTRVGLETLLLVASVLLAIYLEIGPVPKALLIILVVTVPFALIRTGGFLLKFSIFKDDIWFRSYFHKYYEELIH